MLAFVILGIGSVIFVFQRVGLRLMKASEFQPELEPVFLEWRRLKLRRIDFFFGAVLAVVASIALSAYRPDMDKVIGIVGPLGFWIGMIASFVYSRKAAKLESKLAEGQIKPTPPADGTASPDDK